MKRFAVVAFFACGLALVLWAESRTRPSAVPTFESARAAKASSDFLLEDSSGELLSRVRRDFRERRQEWVSITEVPSSARALILTTEDRRFERHSGVDPRALVAAAWSTLTGHRRGGSTITMQVAKRLDMAGSSRSLAGKARQIRAALALERAWTKNEILEAYLNLAPFRGELVGFPAAARASFGKSVDRLSIEESALLVASLRAPNAPVETIASRACRLLESGCEIARSLASRLESSRMPADPDLASHLAVMLASRSSPFRSTIDRELQRRAHEILSSRLRGLNDRNVRDGAVIVIENSTGRLLASVGSAGPYSRSPFVDGTRALRQAGSTLKPFLYALAFDRKILAPDSWIEDSPVDLVFPGNGVYRPRNHDRSFHGWVKARTALASSLNVPAVKVLKLVGQEAFAETLTRAGLRLDSAADYGPALALGVADLPLFDLTRAYLALANGGRFRDVVLERDAISTPGENLFSAEAAAAVAEILSSRSDRALGFGFDSGLELPFAAAVKTGTSKDMRDNWCLGWTRDFTIGVWVGNFDGEPMWNVSGLSGAAPAWIELARWLHEHRRPQATSPIVARGKPEPERAPSAFPKPRIEYPPTGLIVALDPEIPDDRQKIPLIAAATGSAKLSWRVNGKSLAPAGSEALWSPRRGAHRIELVDSKGAIRDEVRIVVR